MDGRIDHHRVVILHAVNLVSKLARIDVCDFLIHVEEVAVALAYNVDTEALDALREVEEHGQTCVVNAEALVAALLGSTRSNVAGNEVTECRIAALQIVVAVFLRNVASLLCSGLQSLGVLKLLGHPDTSVVTQRLRHKRKLRLVVSVYRDTCRVDLNVRRIGEVSALAVARHGSCTVTAHGVG